MYRNTPGLAADLTVFDVILYVAAARVQAHRILFAAIRAHDRPHGIGCAVTERKVAIEIELVVVVVKSKAHSENVRMVHSSADRHLEDPERSESDEGSRRRDPSLVVRDDNWLPSSNRTVPV